MKGSPGIACIKKNVPVATHQRESKRKRDFFSKNLGINVEEFVLEEGRFSAPVIGGKLFAAGY